MIYCVCYPKPMHRDPKRSGLALIGREERVLIDREQRASDELGSSWRLSRPGQENRGLFRSRDCQGLLGLDWACVLHFDV